MEGNPRWIALTLAMVATLPATAAALDVEVAFVSTRSGERRPYVRCRDGRELELLARPIADSGLSWFPDGESLAFGASWEGNQELYRLDLASGSIVRLTDDPAHDWHPRVSPEGTRIAFVSERDGAAEPTYLRRDLWVLEVGSGALTRWTRNDLYEEPGGFLPDGRMLVARLLPGEGETSEADADLFAVAADGSEERIVRRPGFDGGASVAPDGTVLFHGDGPAGPDLFRVDPRGGEIAALTADAVQDYQPRATPDGAGIVWTRGGPPDDYDVWIANADGSEPRPLVASPGRDAAPALRPVSGDSTPCLEGATGAP